MMSSLILVSLGDPLSCWGERDRIHWAHASGLVGIIYMDLAFTMFVEETSGFRRESFEAAPARTMRIDELDAESRRRMCPVRTSRLRGT